MLSWIYIPMNSMLQEMHSMDFCPKSRHQLRLRLRLRLRRLDEGEGEGKGKV